MTTMHGRNAHRVAIIATLSTLFLISQVTVAGAQQAPARQTDARQTEVVAVVNGQSIGRTSLGHETLRRYGEDVLESMVNKYLILQACKQNNIAITDANVEEELERIAAKFGLSNERYLQMLQQERKISPAEYRRDIVWPMLALRKLVAAQTQVSEAEFNKAFVSQYGESVKCRMIVVPEQNTIRQLHQRAKADPAQFGQLAKDFSKDEASASVRGMIPPIRHDTGDPLFEKTAFSLQPMQISDPFQVADQWVMLQCVKHVPPSHPPAQMMSAIRQQITDRIRDQKMRTAGTDLFQRMQQQAQVVNVLASPELKQQYPAAAALINGQQVTLAQVITESVKRHGVEVLEGEINRTLLAQELKRKNLSVTQADLDEEVARAAEAYGYITVDRKPDVKRWLDFVMKEQGATKDLYVQDAVWPSVALKKLVADQVQVTAEDLRKGFESNYGARVEVLAIVLPDQKTAQRIWDLARSNATDEYFGQLAEQYSIEPVSQSNLGKVPPIRRYGGQPSVEDEAFKLQPGELSGIVATGDRYIIMRCQGLTEPIVSQMDAEVQQQLGAEIKEKKIRIAMSEEFDRIKAAGRIDNYLAGTTQDGMATSASIRR